MAGIDARRSLATTAAIIVTFILTVITSFRTRGGRRTVWFLLLGLGLPISAEYDAINRMHILRHHLQPQYKGIPLAIGLAWYTVGYNTFAMLESLAIQAGISARSQRLWLPLATALTATSMDLVTDVALLEQGYWQWAVDGPYAPDVRGPNGKHGIPIANYTGWLALTGAVTALYLLLTRPLTMDASQSNAAEGVRSGRQAALLLLPGYLGAVAWELGKRRWVYIAYSLLFPVVLLWALAGKRRRGGA